jgi:hypothetical protein
MDGNHLVVTCTLSSNDNEIQSYALTDCGATGISFIDEEYARHHKIPLTPLKTPRALEVIDGRPIESGDITHMAQVQLTINEHKETLPMFVTKLGHYPIVLGIPWLRLHDPAIRFASNRITFDSDYCLNHCSNHPITVQGISIPIPESGVSESACGTCTRCLGRLPCINVHTELTFEENSVQDLAALEDVGLVSPTEKPEPPAGPPDRDASRPLQAALVGCAAFKRLARNKNHRYGKERLQIFALSLYDVNRALDRKKIDEGDLKDLVPAEYHEFLPLFSEAVANQLPPHRPYNHKIPLKEGFTPPFGPLYSLSRTELEELKRWLEENLSKGFIRASSSPAGAPILFVKKEDGSLRLCVDYRGLNEGTIKNRYPLPLIRETLNNLSKAKWFTKLDVRGAYNLLRMAEGEEWKTAFRTRYGLFKSLVMPFGLTNAPADFQHFINDVLHPFLDRFCTAFLDDVLIYSDTLEEHKEHVR